jgi:hypothetical protein
MKPICASLIVALFAISVAGKDRHCIFRVHAKANPNDTTTFRSAVRESFSGERILS